MAADRARHSGFTLIEVIVALALMIIMAAVILPSVVRSVDRARVDDAASELGKIVAGITQFRSDVREYPGRLHYLTTPLVDGNFDGCITSTIGNGNIGRWNGPYFTRVIPGSGLPVSIGVADTLLARDNSGAVDMLQIRITNVQEQDAIDLNEKVDNDGSSTAGNVRWGPVANGLTTLLYGIPVNGC